MNLAVPLSTAWRLHSVRACALFGALWSGWLVLPADYQAAIISMLGLDPGKLGPLIAFAGIVYARLKPQPGVTGAAQPQSPGPATAEEAPKTGP